MPTNLDLMNNKDKTVPVLEMRIPISELDIELDVGDTGTLLIPVQVVDISDKMATFRKVGKIAAENFAKESLDELRKKIGVVEEEEVPFNERMIKKLPAEEKNK